MTLSQEDKLAVLMREVISCKQANQSFNEFVDAIFKRMEVLTL